MSREAWVHEFILAVQRLRPERAAAVQHYRRVALLRYDPRIKPEEDAKRYVREAANDA